MLGYRNQGYTPANLKPTFEGNVLVARCVIVIVLHSYSYAFPITDFPPFFFFSPLRHFPICVARWARGFMPFAGSRERGTGCMTRLAWHSHYVFF